KRLIPAAVDSPPQTSRPLGRTVILAPSSSTTAVAVVSPAVADLNHHPHQTPRSGLPSPARPPFSPAPSPPCRRPSHQPHRRMRRPGPARPSLPPTSPIAAAAECHIEIFKPTSPNTDLTPAAASDLQVAAQLP
ncbi:hypothetical protein Dimus_001896, partial [Dionaea muscipula]